MGIGIDEARLQQYISNLERLGILRVSDRAAKTDDEYHALATALRAEFPGRNAFSTKESIVVTPIGQQFLSICVRVRAR